ncbi:ABC transporter permease subunit [Zophobihabitans entericus]|uniref:ABC transporter permease subunit n=1 Tax=Zophobihabitans entericus TaxID=1635327 RepID=A0A6G9I9E3_9GAMM|nr:ABC transporter permease subunit [Zophobihabitans entericus]QIQ20841.1 ABC transporter permease subunit [Zophobihabitans entericus]
MIVYILRKICTFLLILLILAQISFAIVYCLPGTAFYNLTFFHAYFTFFNELLSGTIRLSPHSSLSLLQTLKQILPITIELCIFTILFSLIIGVPLGIIGGLNTNKWQNKALQSFCLIIGASPLVWIAVLSLFIFFPHLPNEGSFIEQTNPITGFPLIDILLTPGIDTAQELWKEFTYLVLPVVILSIQPCILAIQLLSQNIEKIAKQNYIKTAIIREQSQLKILWRHLLPNALPPVIPQLTHGFTILLFSTMVVEIVFDRYGLGKWVMHGFETKNGVIIAVAILVCGLLIGAFNLLSEIFILVIHPLRHKELYDK